MRTLRYRSRVLLIIGVIAAVGVISAGAAYGYLTQVPVLTGPVDQTNAAGEGTTLAWAQDTTAHPGDYNAYARIGTGPARRINPAGTSARPGGLWDDRLMFQQDGGTGSILRIYNVTTGGYYRVPGGWNSPGSQSAPTMSGDNVLFSRYIAVTHRWLVLVGNLYTHSLTVVGAEQGLHARALAGQVSGVWAVWTECRDVRVGCDVYEYNINSHNTTKLSNTFASGGYQDSPSVAANGTVYFIHEHPGCVGVTLNKRALGSPRVALAVMPERVGAGPTFVDDSGPSPVVYYTQRNCSSHQGDVYKVTDQ